MVRRESFDRRKLIRGQARRALSINFDFQTTFCKNKRKHSLACLSFLQFLLDFWLPSHEVFAKSAVPGVCNIRFRGDTPPTKARRSHRHPLPLTTGMCVFILFPMHILVRCRKGTGYGVCSSCNHATAAAQLDKIRKY